MYEFVWQLDRLTSQLQALIEPQRQTHRVINITFAEMQMTAKRLHIACMCHAHIGGRL